MKSSAFFLCVFVCVFITAFFPATAVTLPATEFPGEEPAPALFNWNLQWAGSWYKSIPRSDDSLPPFKDIFPGGTFFNRGDFRLSTVNQDITLRVMATDKRDLPLDDDDGRAGFHPGFGLYHWSSSSRFLFGVMSEHGLPARINNVWNRSVPFMENRGPSSRDLKLEPAARDEGKTYLYLALPHSVLQGFDAFVHAALDAGRNPSFGTGFGFDLDGAVFNMEGFYSEKELSPRTSSTWFSQTPPLPERDFRIYALSMLYNSPNFGLAADWAFSQTFAWGEGMYGSFALRLGNRPWRFSLAADGAESRFADRSGSTAGSGFRLAARGERFFPRSGLVRFQSTLRAPALGEHFERGSLSLFYRISAPTAQERRENPGMVRLTRVSASFNRDARTPEKTSDTLNVYTGVRFGVLNTVFSCTLNGHSDFGKEKQPFFSPAAFREFNSLRFTCEVGFAVSHFNIRTRLGYTIRNERDPLWEYSLNASFRRAEWGRLSLNIAATDFPEKWDYTLSWRYGLDR